MIRIFQDQGKQINSCIRHDISESIRTLEEINMKAQFEYKVIRAVKAIL